MGDELVPTTHAGQAAPLPVRAARLVYLGTPALAVPPLRALVAAGHEIALVVSRADVRRGRGSAKQPSPVKQAALDLALPVTDDLSDVVAVGADLGVVVAYGRIIPSSVLAELPMVNIHFSLLPRWRGAAPVERAILAGDRETGVGLMVVEAGLDTGGVLAERRVTIGADESADLLRERLVQAGAEMLVEALAGGLPAPMPQTGEPLYAEKLRAEEFEIDWARPAEEIERLVRIGGAWTTFRGKRLKVWRVRLADGSPAVGPSLVPAPFGVPGSVVGASVVAGTGALELIEVQPEGRARIEATAWVRGARPVAGEQLGVPRS